MGSYKINDCLTWLEKAVLLVYLAVSAYVVGPPYMTETLPEGA
jgi:hypothetical protein